MIFLCEVCGTEFEAIRHAKYCPNCRVGAYRANNTQKQRERRADKNYISKKINFVPVTKKCLYCGKEFECLHPSQKYCSDECHKKRNSEWAMNKAHEGKVRICPICNNELPKFKDKYCSKKCSNRANAIRRGECQDHGLLTKQCVVCGKEFQTFKSRKITCSDECSRHNKSVRPTTSEENRQKYLKKHPNARRKEDIIREAQEKKEIKRANYEKWLAQKEVEWAENRAKKEAQKQANIAYWLEYEAEHECCVCGKKFIANYPLTKYCSDTCKRRNYKVRDTRHRYKNITVDRGITLPKLAKRDHNQCQICGLFVDWNDYIKTDKTTICGDMYPSIDHITPISLGGLHSWSNVQLAHRGCNTRKNNKYVG